MFLGIEIGGTKLQLALGLGHGALAGSWRGRVEPAAGAEGIRRQITAALPQLLTDAGVDRSQLRGVGIGFGGPVDDRKQTVIKSHQIAGWDGFPLADWLANLLELPAALGNDADVAGLAEVLFGAGQSLSPIFYITIGSGIGGGLIINGEIYRGCGQGAAEIGHLRWPTAAGEVDIVEHTASGWGLTSLARQQGTSRQDDPACRQLLALGGGSWDQLTSQHIASAAANQNPFALEILHVAWTTLAEGICQVIALLCPRRIVIGGGVSLMGEELLFQPLRRLVAERVFRPFAACYDIVPAALGEEVVLHGALALARQRLGG